jgi:hypothetical protein
MLLLKENENVSILKPIEQFFTTIRIPSQKIFFNKGYYFLGENVLMYLSICRNRYIFNNKILCVLNKAA